MIKTVGKKLTSLALAAALTVSTAVAVSAANTTVKLPYDVSVTGTSLSLLKSGKAVAGYALKSADVSFTSGKTGNLLLCFTDSTGKNRYISFGKQATLKIGGTLKTVSIQKALKDDVAVSIDNTANITKLSVDSPNTITVSGKIASMNLSEAAKVTVKKGAKVTKTTKSNSRATVAIERGATAAAPTTAKRTTPTKRTTVKKTTSQTNSGDVRLKIDPLEGDEGDRLLDLLDELNENVYAYDKDTYEDIEGECTWNYPRYAELDDDDDSYPFTFTPDDDSYAPVKSKVMIYVEGAFGDISLHYKKRTLECEEGDELRDMDDALEDNVTAYDDNDEEVDGSFKWEKSRSTEIRERKSYEFTFRPKKGSRYDNEDGKIEFEFVKSDDDKDPDDEKK